jgi:subtilisin family serine protease
MTSATQEPDRPVDTTGMAAQPRRTDPDFDLLIQHASRTLDPTSAVRFRNQRLHSTVYGAAQLLVRPTEGEEAVIDKLVEVAKDLGWKADVNPTDERLVELARMAGIGPTEPQPLLRRVQLTPLSDQGLVELPDAWQVLQRFRASYPDDATKRDAVQLDHVLTSHSEGIFGNPYWRVPGTTGNPYWRVPGTTGNPYWRVPGTGNPYLDVPSGVAEYGIPGFGGRAPVAWVGPEPDFRSDAQLDGQRRPVIALLDTGVGKHRWFPASVVDHNAKCAELTIGLTDPKTAPEDAAVRINPLLGELDEVAGHGTFCAGLIRQKCPVATILAIRVIQADGVVTEADLLETLNKLWLRQKLAIKNSKPQELIDIVSMSLGYYHEDFEDLQFDPLLLAPIRALAQLGVMIVVSSGNDATTRPMYPAAFAPYPGGIIPELLPDELPVVAVGGSNPDHTVALFSNEGAWVRAHRPGAALVSTMPPFDASGSPRIEVDSSDVDRTLRTPRPNNVRSTIDPDDFTSGFGVWSGTSFAAPILAGELAQYLTVHQRLAGEDVDPTHAVDRGWNAISNRVPELRRPGQGERYNGVDNEAEDADSGGDLE